MTGLIGRGLSRLQRLTSPHRRDTPALPVFPEVDRLFFTSPYLLTAQNLGGIVDPYKNHAWVYACVNAIAMNISGVNLNFYMGSKKDKQEIEEGQIPKLFESPNPLMSGSQLIEASQVYMGLTGEAIWILDRASERELPREIWTFDPARFKEKVDKSTGLITGWTYSKGVKTIELADYEVVFFRYFNPYNDYRGLSPLSAAASGVNQDYWAGIYNGAFFQNSAQPGGVLESNAILDDDEHRRILAQVNDRHGGASKAHKIMLLEGGLTYKQTGLTQKDMDFLEGRRFNREEILGVYKVPKGELGIEDDTGSYAKDKTRRKLFWETTLCPKMALMEYVIWAQFLSKFPGPGQIWAEFDYKSIPALQEDQNEKDSRAVKYFSMGVPFNVLNQALDLGLPEIPGGDIGYLPFNLVPVGGAGTPPPAPGKALPAAKAAATINLQPEPVPGLPPLGTRLHLAGPTRAAASWLQYHQMQTAYEEKLRGKIKRYFWEQRKGQLQIIEDRFSSVVGVLGKGARDQSPDVEALLFDLEEANGHLKATIWPFYLNIGTEAGQAMTAELGGDPTLFVLRDTPAMAILEEKLIKVVGINDVTREMLRSTLLEGLENTEAVREMQDRVREVFNFAESRSLTIARTETGQAASPARIAAMTKMGVTEIEWGTAGDGKVRASHVNCSGAGKRRIGEPFPNGCLYPNDPRGPAGEIINCRCVSLPVVE